jgi:UDP-N-acetylglucosamine--N-acetylmuramyl-(pentapeptide) pyrophosphoryl-undecaprenol N-acetylglucosamine transferase
VLAAEAVLDRVRAEVVVGFNGYLAGPAYLAAGRQGLLIVVHEANARPGVANRLAARSSWPVTSSARPPNDAGSPPENHVISRRTVARRVVPR